MDPVLLFLAVVAGLILFRLFSVMGTRTGHEPHSDKDPIESIREASPRPRADNGQEEIVPAAPKPVSTNARVLRDADPDFDEGDFLRGARSAYEMIVEAFAAGDLRSIRNYLGDSVYDAFKQAVVDRETAERSVDLKFVGIDHAAIVASEATENSLQATTEFASNQVRVTRDKDGNVIDGDPNRIDLVKDRWVFARDRGSRDPNWKLIATGSA